MRFSKLLAVSAFLGLLTSNVNSMEFFAGIGVGGDYFKVSPSDDEGKEVLKKLFEKDSFTGMGCNSKIILGAGYLFSGDIYLGAQVHAGMSWTKAKIEGNMEFELEEISVAGQGVAELKGKYNFGGDILLGYAFTPNVLVYLSGGVDIKRVSFEMEATAESPKGVLYLRNEDKTIEGFSCKKIEPKMNNIIMGSVGLGTRFSFTKHLFLGLEAKAMFGRKSEFEIENLLAYGRENGVDNKVEIPSLPIEETKIGFQDYSFGCTIGFKL